MTKPHQQYLDRDSLRKSTSHKAVKELLEHYGIEYRVFLDLAHLRALDIERTDSREVYPKLWSLGSAQWALLATYMITAEEDLNYHTSNRAFLYKLLDSIVSKGYCTVKQATIIGQIFLKRRGWKFENFKIKFPPKQGMGTNEARAKYYDSRIAELTREYKQESTIEPT